MNTASLHSGFLAFACTVAAYSMAHGDPIEDHGLYLSAIDRVTSVHSMSFDGRPYEIRYLPVGVPYDQARDENGELIASSVLSEMILDAGVRTLEVIRVDEEQLLPKDESLARTVVGEFCSVNGGWPADPEDLARVLMGWPDTMGKMEFVSFSHGAFRFPEVCYEQ